MRELFSSAECFVIGASAGGVEALRTILPAFKKTEFFKIAVVIHLPAQGPNLLPALLSSTCELGVSEAVPGENFKRDHIYFAPSDYHLCLEQNYTLSLSSEELVNFSRPSIDILFESAAYSFGPKTVGILLSGANNDGAYGLKQIKEAGGMTIIQDPKDAEYKTMPEAALELLTPHCILASKDIARLISDLCSKGTTHA